MNRAGDGLQPVFKNPGDWVAIAALVPFFVSVFGLKWISVGVRVNVFGRELVDEKLTSLGMLEVPWYWVALLLIVLAAFIGCFFFVKARGGVTLGAGLYFLIFNVLFFVGAWYKINAIIGDITATARSVPFVGELLGNLVKQISKNVLVVRLGPGYWVFIAAGVLLVVGGSLRLAAGHSGPKSTPV